MNAEQKRKIDDVLIAFGTKSITCHHAALEASDRNDTHGFEEAVLARCDARGVALEKIIEIVEAK